MPKRGRSRKKSRTHVDGSGDGASSALTDTGGTATAKIPKSLVMRRGKTAPEVHELVLDLRRVMAPYTASHFQDTDATGKVSLSQLCAALALPMGVTHILQVSQRIDRCNLRLARVPEGPTLSFRVHQFSLTRHVQRLQRRPVAYTGSLTTHPPVVVTNNFGDHAAAPHIKLLRITFQNLFPQINVSTVKLKDCRRVVLFNLIERSEAGDAGEEDGGAKTTQVVEMRHYAVRATPVGVDRKVRRLVQAKLPNLHNVNDIADYLTGQSTALPSDGASDSEPEDDPAYTVRLSDRYAGAGCHAAQKSALKLVELGPRLTLELVKVDRGLAESSSANSQCLYHAHVTKSPAEVAARQAAAEAAAAAKRQRRAVQDANVASKRGAAERARATQRPRRGLDLREPGGSTAAAPRRDDLRIEGVSSSDDDDGDDNRENEEDDAE